MADTFSEMGLNNIRPRWYSANFRKWIRRLKSV